MAGLDPEPARSLRSWHRSSSGGGSGTVGQPEGHQAAADHGRRPGEAGRRNSDAPSSRPRHSEPRAAVWLIIRAPEDWRSESTLSGPDRRGLLAYVLREYDDVAQIVPGGLVEFSAAGNKAERGPACVAVDSLRKVCLQVQRCRIDPENGRL